jgi:PAS domain S-box-containing protein/excisionase family DNA binding protein
MKTTGDSQTFADYLTVSEAAEYLGVSPWTLRNWDNSGKLRPIRHPVNGYRIYRGEDLELLLKTETPLGRRKSAWTPRFDWNEIGASEHFVQFYESDQYLVESVSAFVGDALTAGDAAVIIATEPHRNRIQKKLRARGLDLQAARDSAQYVSLDAADTLSAFMRNGSPDPEEFFKVVGREFERLTVDGRRIRAFGEMVALLWHEGNAEAACRLEELWNELAKKHSFALFCAYPLNGFDEQADGIAFDRICTCHSRVIPGESYAALTTCDEQLREIGALQQKAQALEAEIARRVEAERELADFIDNALEGLHKVGADGTILWANKAELDLLGYRQDEYVGRHIAEFHANQDVIDEMLSKLMSGQNLFDYPASLRCRDGSVKQVLIHSNAYMRDGKFVYSRCFTRDVTESITADRDRALLAEIVDSSEDAIVSKTLEGIVRSWNAGAERLFGYAASEAVGQPITLIIPAERRDEEVDILRRLQSGERIEHFETVRVAKDGRPIDISLTISPVRDRTGRIIGASKIARDITDRKRAEEALQQADRRKDEFLATLAHELRNPLAPIRNSLQILRMTGDSSAAVQRLYEMIERQVAHMVRLVDDLLELSRISRGKIELRTGRVELSTIINHAVETSKPMIDAAKHQLSVALPPEPLVLEADAVRLAQVFANLLNNAAKYTLGGGKITVAARREANEVVVSVRDTGIGIPREMLPRIFDMFAQIKNELRRTQDGLGIGLSLVRTLVSMHGGTVEAESAGLGHGSQFTVRLPLAKIEPQEPKAEHRQSGPEPSLMPARRIVAVDDNRDAADSLGMLLKILGADVHVAYDGQSALEAIRICRPSVVLLDLGMPGMDGYEVARRIRQDPEASKVLLIALTGWGQEDDRRRSKEAGFDHHLIKPVELGALQALLASLDVKRR